MARQEALVLCARSDPKYEDPQHIPPHITAASRPCGECGADLVVSPSTVALEDRYTVVYRCNPCGKADAARRGVKKLGIAPGALPGDTPDQRRRRNELEAHGFRDLENP